MDLEDAWMLGSPSPGGNAEEVHGPATVPPCRARVPRPQLQAQDVMSAARPHWFSDTNAEYGTIPAFLQEFSMALSTEQMELSGMDAVAAPRHGMVVERLGLEWD